MYLFIQMLNSLYPTELMGTFILDNNRSCFITKHLCTEQNYLSVEFI